MSKNPEELEESLQKGISALMAKTAQANKVTTDPQDHQKLANNVNEVLDLIGEEDQAEAAALAILEGLDQAEAIIAKNLRGLPRIKHLAKSLFQGKTHDEQHLAKAKEILRNQGPQGIKTLLGKLTWESAKAQTPMESARFTRIGTKIENLLPNQTS